MNRIGLEIGVNTGLNLNQLLFNQMEKDKSNTREIVPKKKSAIDISTELKLDKSINSLKDSIVLEKKPHTPKPQSKKIDVDQAKSMQLRVANDLVENPFTTPRPTKKKLFTQKKSPITAERQRQKSPAVSQIVDDFDFENRVPTRKVEKTNSDISVISKISKFLCKPKKLATDDSAISQLHYTSNRRLVEKDYSEFSQVSKSPFLTLRKEPLGQIAGTLFDRGQPSPENQQEIAQQKFAQPLYNGSFQLAKSALIMEQENINKVYSSTRDQYNEEDSVSEDSNRQNN